MGVVYHAHYLVYFELGRTEWMRCSGVPYAGIEDRGLRLAVIEARVRYRRPVQYDRQISVATTVSAVAGASVIFDYELRDESGAVLASGFTRLGCLDTNNRPTRLPADILQALGRTDAPPSSEETP